MHTGRHGHLVLPGGMRCPQRTCTDTTSASLVTKYHGQIMGKNDGCSAVLVLHDVLRVFGVQLLIVDELNADFCRL